MVSLIHTVVSDTHWSLIFMRFSGNYIVITSDFGAKESSRPPYCLPYKTQYSVIVYILLLNTDSIS